MRISDLGVNNDVVTDGRKETDDMDNCYSPDWLIGQSDELLVSSAVYSA